MPSCVRRLVVVELAGVNVVTAVNSAALACEVVPTRAFPLASAAV